jgi:FKBP-type peptidyl-prolyl cis-trans isomerase (trigger factor)
MQTFQELAKAFSRKDLPLSQIELAGEIPAEQLESYKEKALHLIAESLDLPGFRKGHVPHDMALKKAGEIAVLEEAAEIFMRDFYPVLMTEQKIDAVGRPDIRITKLAPNNPIGLTVTVTIYPEVTLPNGWKDLAKKIPLEPYTGELPKMEVPPSAEEEQKARDYMAHNQRRGKLIDALIEKTKLEVPTIFIESELEKIIGQLRDDCVRFGMAFDEYLKRVGKTEETIRNEFREQAQKRAKLQLTLNKIAEEEKVEADPIAVEEEMKHAMEHFPDARRDLVKIHIETVLKNEKTLQLLEGGETK